jgi:hypothetical protein
MLVDVVKLENMLEKVTMTDAEYLKSCSILGLRNLFGLSMRSFRGPHKDHASRHKEQPVRSCVELIRSNFVTIYPLGYLQTCSVRHSAAVATISLGSAHHNSISGNLLEYSGVGLLRALRGKDPLGGIVSEGSQAYKGMCWGLARLGANVSRTTSSWKSEPSGPSRVKQFQGIKESGEVLEARDSAGNERQSSNGG